jgi:hypothetical protein
MKLISSTHDGPLALATRIKILNTLVPLSFVLQSKMIVASWIFEIVTVVQLHRHQSRPIVIVHPCNKVQAKPAHWIPQWMVSHLVEIMKHDQNVTISWFSCSVKIIKHFTNRQTTSTDWWILMIFVRYSPSFRFTTETKSDEPQKMWVH